MTRKKMKNMLKNMLGYFQLTQKPTFFLFHSSLKSGIKFCSYNIKKGFHPIKLFCLGQNRHICPPLTLVRTIFKKHV